MADSSTVTQAATQEQAQAATQEQAQAANTETAVVQDTNANTQPIPVATEKATTTQPEMTLDVALKELADARKDAARYRNQQKAAEKAKTDAEEVALKEQGKFKELYEKAQEELRAKVADLAKRDREDLQRKVAADLKLPAKLATRIRGETEAEMVADAKELLTGLPPVVVNNDARAGTAGSAPQVYPLGMSPEQVAQFLHVDVKNLPKG